MRSTQSGTAANTASRHSRTALGEPGRLRISAEPRTPAVWRERIAVGTWGPGNRAHRFAETGEFLVEHRGGRLRGDVARGGSGAPGGNDQATPGLVDQLDQSRAD